MILVSIKSLCLQDSPNCAKAIAKQLNLDDFRAGVLPEDKASYIESLKKKEIPL